MLISKVPKDVLLIGNTMRIAIVIYLARTKCTVLGVL
jgi:hypothetical protein